MKALHVFLAGVAVALVVAGCPGEEDNPCEDLNVPARPADSRTDVFTPTGRQVQAGTALTITATGAWDSGLGRVGPDGDDRLLCAGCPVNAPLGALIGRIGAQGPPFFIGSQATLTTTDSGELFLGMNDNAVGHCAGPAGSCYDDNRGALCVAVH